MTTAQDRDASSSRYGGARDAVSSAYSSARERTAGLAQRAGEGLNENPVPFLLGGLALGAIAGALLPRTEREAEVLGPFGSRVTNAARAAFEAAKETGGSNIDGFKLNADNARGQATQLLGEVAKAAGQAGLSAFRGQGAADR